MIIAGFQSKATRREMLKRALKASAYTAPVVLASAIPLTVGAVTGPTGPSLFVVPASGGAGTLFAFYGVGFAPNTNYDVLFTIGRTGVNPGPFPVTSNAFGSLAFGGDSTGVPLGAYALGVALRGTKQIFTQVSFTVTFAALPTTPGVLVAPTSGPVGTFFSLSAFGLRANTLYQVLYTVVPAGASTGVADPSEFSNGRGQIGIQIDSSNLIPGAYTLGIALKNAVTIITQITITVTGAAGSMVQQSATVPSGTAVQFKFAA